MPKIFKYWFVLTIWLVGLFLRCYRQSVHLGFYYDQARDATIANDIITGKNFPAIGPTTGIQGLHLGPFWYYLITPGYLIGRGSPVIASYFIAFLESLTIPLIYFLLRRYWNHQAAIITATLWSLSYYIIRSARWFSNPSPIPFFTIAIIWLLVKIVVDRKVNYLPILVFLFGLSLQLEAASAVFFLPSVVLVFLLNHQIFRHIRPRQYFWSIFGFLFLLVPQVLFDLKNNFLIIGSFFKFIAGDTNTLETKTWAIPSLQFVLSRLQEYYKIFFSKLDTNLTPTSIFFLVFFLVMLIILTYQHWSQPFYQIVFIWLFVPLLLLLFFSGNYGRLYDYYLTGFFVPFFILFGITVASIPVVPLIVLLLFFRGNITFTYNFLLANPDGPQHITLGNQLQALTYLCQAADNEPYVINFYVPAIIPTTYDYLHFWLQSRGRCPPALPWDNDSNSHIFSLYEIDQQHPEKVEKWLDSQNVIAEVKIQKHFGGIVVQQRLKHGH